jgi:hypothetical protein
VYTTDESSADFKHPRNMTDSQVKRTKTEKLVKEVKAARAEKEREAMLDAYNYLNKREHRI